MDFVSGAVDSCLRVKIAKLVENKSERSYRDGD